MDLPQRMQHLPVFQGLPIPFFTLVQNGRPNFRAHDGDNHRRAMIKRLCGVCGQPLDYWMAFIAGPMVMKSRLSFMPALHEECALAALQLCPFLANEEHAYSSAPLGEGNVVIATPPPKPPRTALVKTRSYEVVERQRDIPGMEYAFFAPPKFATWYRYQGGRLARESVTGSRAP